MIKATRKMLEAHFDTAFSAPGGMARLRELILTLAMQGKLVEQDPDDPPASELLKEIEAEKRRLVKEGKIKKPKALPLIKPEEVPYELPEGWAWVRLGEIAFQITDGAHHTPTYIEEGIPFLSVKDMSSGSLNFSNTRFISPEQHQELIKRCYPQKGDLLLTKVGTTGIPVLVDVDYEFSIFVSVALIKFPQNLLLGKFLSWLIRAPLLKKQSEEGTEGVGNKNLVLRKITNFLLAFPPLPEQHRIVASIDQLMARCDALEKLRKQQEEKRLIVHDAAIKQLIDVPDRSAWDFIQQHFGKLYTVKENVAELRKAILQLAVMGRLVPQDPNDQPASELLKEIEAEKQRLVKIGKMKKPKALPSIKPEELPYELPRGWAWTRFEDVVDIGSGITKGRRLEGRKIFSIPYLRVANVQRGYLDLLEVKEIEIPIEESDKYQLVNGDLLITEGGDWDKVGRTCIWRGEIPLCGHQNHIFRARKLLECQNEIWLEKCLNSPILREYFASASKQTTNLASINKTQLRACPIPLPPLPEQHRIVARIDQLMTLCDTLEHQIDAATVKQTELLNAVMAQV